MYTKNISNKCILDGSKCFAHNEHFFNNWERYNVIYNIPQIVKTYRTKSTVDFSEWFLFLRIFGNIIWVAYAIEVESMLMLINNVTVIYILVISN